MEELDFEPIDEVLENNEEIETLNIDENPSNTEENMIKIDRLFNVTEDEDRREEQLNKEKETKKDRKIEKIQLGLIIFLVVSATLIYFFGYNLVEPFIKLE